MAVGLQTERNVAGAISAGLSWSFAATTGIFAVDPLTGPQLKLAAAHDKLNELVNSYATFTDGLKADGLTVHNDPQTGQHIFRFRVAKPPTPDPSWSVVIGEIAHLLRSCLDNLAWQLALLNTSDPFSRTEFPIYFFRRTKTGSGYIPSAISKRNGKTTGKIRSISTKHRAMMERAQPYHTRKRRERHPLWILHEMDNVDKHRDIHFTFTANTATAIKISRGGNFMFGGPMQIRTGIPFEDGAELIRMSPVISQTPVSVKPDYSINVCFDNRCPKPFSNLVVIETLRKIETRVKEIVETFAPEFTQ